MHAHANHKIVSHRKQTEKKTMTSGNNQTPAKRPATTEDPIETQTVKRPCPTVKAWKAFKLKYEPKDDHSSECKWVLAARQLTVPEDGSWFRDPRVPPGDHPIPCTKGLHSIPFVHPVNGRGHCALDVFAYVQPLKAVVTEIECADHNSYAQAPTNLVRVIDDAKSASAMIRVIGRVNGRIAQPDNACWASDRTDSVKKFLEGTVILAATFTDGILDSRPLLSDDNRVAPSMVCIVRHCLSELEPLSLVKSYVYQWHRKMPADEHVPMGPLVQKQKNQTTRLLLNLSGEDLLKLREMPPLFRLLFGDALMPWSQRDNGLFVDMPCLRPEILQLFEDFTGSWELQEGAVHDRSLLLWTCLFIKAYLGSTVSPVDLNTFIHFHWKYWETLQDNDYMSEKMESNVQNKVVRIILDSLIEHPISLACVIPDSSLVEAQLGFFRLVFQWNACINERRAEAELCDSIVSRFIRTGRVRDFLLPHFWPEVVTYGTLVTDQKAFFCGPEIEKIVLEMVNNGEHERLSQLLFHRTVIPVGTSGETHFVHSLWRQERPKFYADIFAHERMLSILPLALRSFVNEAHGST